MSTLLYNPDRKDKKQFLEEFAIRTELFDELFKDIKSGKMHHPEQHYLLVGQRGAGKTTLLNRLKYAIDDDTALNKWLIPVLFNEEQYHISELANVWENIATYLEDYYGFEGICDEIESQLSKNDFEDKALNVLLTRLDAQNRKIILFIDNIGDLLNKFSRLEVHRLREVLQTKGQIRIIAGSTLALESLTDYQQPLFEFFKVVRLEGLSFEESLTLLLKLADVYHEQDKIKTIIDHSPSRIETLRVLSGGVPRTIALLFHVFVDNEHGTALSDLEKVLDSVTPLYKHRMDDLPTQQQKIVDAVAKNWDPVSVKKLVTVTRLESKVISAQLKQLERNQVIEILSTGKKNHTYMLKERFYNIWYLMRYGRKQDRNRVIWLVKFLEVWCSKEEIEDRILNYVGKFQNSQMDQATMELYGQVYSYFTDIKSDVKYQLKSTLPEAVDKHVQYSEHDYECLFKEFLDNGDWEKIVHLFLNKSSLTEKEKIYVLNPIIDSEAQTISQILQIFKNHIADSDMDDSMDTPELFIYMIFSITFKTLIIEMSSNEENSKNIKKYIGAFRRYCDVIDSRLKLGAFEVDKMSLLITGLLLNEYYYLADTLIEYKFNNTKFSERFNIYKIVRSLLEANDINKHNTDIAPEILDPAKEMFKRIHLIREKNKEAKASENS